MGEKTGISWTGSTWNWIRGCSREIADGADTSGCGDATGGGCYAERDGGRFCGPGGVYEGLVRITAKGPRWTGRVDVIAHKLLDPIRWQKPRKIFVASVSDPFHPKLGNQVIAAAFGVMAIARRHTFQLLTKRARRMLSWFGWVVDAAAAAGRTVVQFCVDQLRELVAQLIPDETKQLDRAIAKLPPATLASDEASAAVSWPLPNLWLGVSTEHQAAYDERWPLLAQCPAAVRMVSVEPMIGPVSIADQGANPDWAIIGCESGPRAREIDVQAIRDLIGECRDAGTAVWLKQARPADGSLACDAPKPPPIGPGPGSKWKPGSVIERPYLDGAQWLQFPEAHER